MSHRSAFEALDRTLQDLNKNNKLMGGVTTVLAGDFRQTLPVIPRGTKADQLQASLQSSYIWQHTQRLSLKTNMRVYLTGDTSAGHFAEKLLQLGNGSMTPDKEDGTIPLNNLGQIVANLQQLKFAVFPNIAYHFRQHSWLRERAILAPTNEGVKATNKELLDGLPGTLQTYKSVDSVPDPNEAVNYPTEFLNSLQPPGVLHLKVGAPIMLLRNLDPPTLCNGTRLDVKKMMPHVIEATIITGHAAGQDVFLPCIPIIPSALPFQFKRLQFPVCLSFAMTINKAQGQTLKVAGLNLQTPCFSHGQLYVGCSRVGNAKHLFILAPSGRSKNIVYPEVLQH